MNNKTTVTAEDVLLDTLIDNNNSFDIDRDSLIANDCKKAMIEFAKIKCREMRESILEKAFVSPIEGAYYEQEVNKQSILNAYDIEGIK